MRGPFTWSERAMMGYDKPFSIDDADGEAVAYCYNSTHAAEVCHALNRDWMAEMVAARQSWIPDKARQRATPIPDTLSVRARNVLERGGITTLEELSAHTPLDLFKIRSCGKLTVKEFHGVLAAHGMKLAEE